jgi:hypothetical protein
LRGVLQRLGFGGHFAFDRVIVGLLDRNQESFGYFPDEQWFAVLTELKLGVAGGGVGSTENALDLGIVAVG